MPTVLRRKAMGMVLDTDKEPERSPLFARRGGDPMSRDLGPCPPADDLERLLAEQLSRADRDTIESGMSS